MRFILQPWQLFFLILSGLVNRRQQDIIDFQNAQIQALMDKLGRKRILLNDDQRRLLAVKGKALGRSTMMELTTLGNEDIPAYLSSYVQTYVERNVRMMSDVSDMAQFGRFLRLCGALTGREIFQSQLGRELGVNPIGS